MADDNTNQADKPAEKGKKPLWMIILIVLVVGALVYFLFFNSDDDNGDDANTDEAADIEQVEEDLEQADEVADVPIENIILEAVAPYEGDGEATRSWDGTTFVHTVIARIGDPAEGKFYEGWVVNGSIQSTGALEKGDDGVWRLSFESDTDFTTHNRVVITEETEANGLDGVPEDHVLEGTFTSS